MFYVNFFEKVQGYKEMERQLTIGRYGSSVEYLIDMLNSIYEVTMITPYSKTMVIRVLAKNPEQQKVLYFFKISF